MSASKASRRKKERNESEEMLSATTETEDYNDSPRSRSPAHFVSAGQISRGNRPEVIPESLPPVPPDTDFSVPPASSNAYLGDG